MLLLPYFFFLFFNMKCSNDLFFILKRSLNESWYWEQRISFIRATSIYFWSFHLFFGNLTISYNLIWGMFSYLCHHMIKSFFKIVSSFTTDIAIFCMYKGCPFTSFTSKMFVFVCRFTKINLHDINIINEEEIYELIDSNQWINKRNLLYFQEE